MVSFIVLPCLGSGGPSRHNPGTADAFCSVRYKMTTTAPAPPLAHDSKHPDSHTHSVFVAELEDVVPRRHPDLPNLLVGVTVETPEKKLERIKRGAKPKWAKGHIVRLRPDLALGFSKTTSDEAKQQRKALATELSRRGYTVNREKTGVWSTYIVQLDESDQPDVGEGWVYVGETSRTPEERLKQHLSGARNDKTRLFSPVVHKHGQHLRRDLMRGHATLYSKADSKLAEAELAQRLRDQGYVVRGGH
jgi:hypothetical protein